MIILWLFHRNSINGIFIPNNFDETKKFSFFFPFSKIARNSLVKFPTGDIAYRNDYFTTFYPYL